jgi:uncharacterized protein (TIGR02246 family)
MAEDSAGAVADRFVAAINAHDVSALAALMTHDHRFVDATGAVHEGREPMKVGWRQFFEAFPDYRVGVRERVLDGPVVAMFGEASGTFAGPASPWPWPSSSSRTSTSCGGRPSARADTSGCP